MSTSDRAMIVWRKSSRSGQNGQCVEVGTWLKSSRSGQNGNCVEIAPGLRVVRVRDSKDPAGPRLAVASVQWTAFIGSLKTDRLNQD